MLYGKTRIIICQDNADLGRRSAMLVAAKLREISAQKKVVRAVFAAGESQSSFLTALSLETGIPWNRIDCFNIDDFWDTRMPREFTCGFQTSIQLYDKVNPRSVNLVKYNTSDPEAEIQRFSNLIREQPIDVLSQGIGTSGHLALNEPEISNFNDPMWVRLVDVADQSKRQLREDPNFKALGYIPDKGITLTIPAILSAMHCITIVPLALKKPILTMLAKLREPIKELPASVLLQKDGDLFVDNDSCPDEWRI